MSEITDALRTARNLLYQDWCKQGEETRRLLVRHSIDDYLNSRELEAGLFEQLKLANIEWALEVEKEAMLEANV